MIFRRWDKLLIAAIAAHSLALGAALLCQPVRTLRLAGWGYDGPTFFVEQAGLFLLILGAAYVVGLWRRSFAWLLVGSKAAAVVFLVVECFWGHGPRVLFLAALLDSLMGAAVAASLLWSPGAAKAR